MGIPEKMATDFLNIDSDPVNGLKSGCLQKHLNKKLKSAGITSAENTRRTHQKSTDGKEFLRSKERNETRLLTHHECFISVRYRGQRNRGYHSISLESGFVSESGAACARSLDCRFILIRYGTLKEGCGFLAPLYHHLTRSNRGVATPKRTCELSATSTTRLRACSGMKMYSPSPRLYSQEFPDGMKP